MNYTLTWHDFSLNVVVSALSDLLNNYILQLKDYTIDTVEHLIIASILYIIICIILYIAVTRWKAITYNATIKDAERVLFVIAHPDDECMFFGPTILHFTKKTNCQVYLMCLSTGRNYGMGSTRQNELYESCKVLGVSEDRIIVHNHTNLPDAMDVRWPTEIVSQLVLNLVQAYDINTLITFDRHGISRHSNHYSIYYAVAHLILEDKLPKKCSVYVLETINALRKYWLLFDLPLAFILSRIRFVVDCKDRSVIINAMKQHKSQLLWFRYLYVYFSRYLLINTLQKMNLVDVELDLDEDLEIDSEIDE